MLNDTLSITRACEKAKRFGAKFYSIFRAKDGSIFSISFFESNSIDEKRCLTELAVYNYIMQSFNIFERKFWSGYITNLPYVSGAYSMLEEL